ncbi:MAG: hypothetical protein MSG64_18395 [Pyrinomonadaceae bacterium MAG19_C2-C3]|nr:hypothetical protein [Pyrinomonadaceae bacterium MAG19_C2-C3]
MIRLLTARDEFPRTLRRKSFMPPATFALLALAMVLTVRPTSAHEGEDHTGKRGRPRRG